MKKSLLLTVIFTVIFTAYAKDNLKVRCVSDIDRSPVAYVALTVEYPDTIVSYQADRKGKLKFSPSSYPLTITARADGWYDSVIGLMSKPDGTVLIDLSPAPSSLRPVNARRADWSSDRRGRLSSTYTVRR